MADPTMTRDEILALDGRELDAEVGRSVFGMDIKKTYLGPCVEIDPESNFYRMGIKTIPLYSTDANAARLVLAEIERLGKIVELVDAIEDILWPLPVDIDDAVGAWGFLTATPRQICLAALLAVSQV